MAVKNKQLLVKASPWSVFSAEGLLPYLSEINQDGNGLALKNFTKLLEIVYSSLMSERLADKHCVPCRGDEPRLGEDEIQKHKSLLRGDWNVVDNSKISREFKFKDFARAMVFVNRAAEIAEREGHHPDIHIHYNKVVIELWTHAIGGLSDNDFIMAAKIEKLV